MGEQVAARYPWGCSSVGRAPALQAGGQEFESLHLHADNFDKRPGTDICKISVNEKPKISSAQAAK